MREPLPTLIRAALGFTGVIGFAAFIVAWITDHKLDAPPILVGALITLIGISLGIQPPKLGGDKDK